MDYFHSTNLAIYIIYSDPSLSLARAWIASKRNEFKLDYVAI